MATSNTPILLGKKSQAGIVEYHNRCIQAYNSAWNIREQMRQIDLAYIRENDFTTEQQKAKLANRYGNPGKIQNITVPVVMPMVEAAVTYQASVFLTGHPIFGVVANPTNEDAALQMETVIEDQSVRGGWVRELMLFFRDGFKYNLHGLEVKWDSEVTAALETDIGFSTTQAKPKEVVWSGNAIKRLDMYNTFFDTRVSPAELYYKGEFGGYTELMSRIQLKAFIAALPDKMVDNVIPAFESSIGSSGLMSSTVPNGFYFPEINPDALLDNKSRTKDQFNWDSWAGLSGADRKINYKDSYEVTTVYAKILPSDFAISVPAKNTPQIWKFIFVNHSVLIYAERQTNAHGYIPILLGQPLEDGLDFQTKSLATNVKPIQEITSAMWNSSIAARRRAISDRGIYDPSRITEAHINNENPSAKIPLRPAGFGKPAQDAYYAIPFRDDQSPVVMQESQLLLQFANVISGQNPVRQGQFVKGNKTLHEFQSVMTNANGRDQMTSLLIEAQIFTPLKTILKTNILQYQGGVSLFNRELQRQIEIDPVALRKAVMDFKVSDGLTPADKLINSDTLQVAMQVIGSSPQIAAGYNIGPLFSYFIKTQGGRISEFEKSPEQMAYEQAMGAWQSQVQMLMEALKGQDPQTIQSFLKQLPPQPQPQQYGYNPGQQGSAAAAPPAEVATRVNNITNVIQNQEQ